MSESVEDDILLAGLKATAAAPELQQSLLQFRDAGWDESPLFKSVYEEEYGRLAGEPYGCLVGDYYFNHIQADVQLLHDLSQIAAAAHAPFIAAADSTLAGMVSWNELMKPRDLIALFDTPDYVPGDRCGTRTKRSISASACRARSRGYPMGETKRSRSSILRRTPRG